ncbi:hypothetical protein LJC16_02910 [Bacteroidales bacterium OttesenSCG-928-C19]|nr:hypothetical protein [Bacteroidales bacterium OttesenSCG-928-C19]
MLKILNIFLIALLSFVSTGFAQTSKPQVGTWRDHLAHSQATKLAVAGDRVYAGGASGLYYYDRQDGSVNRMTKVQGFSDFGVTNLAYCKKKNALVITYENSNIDLYIDDVVYNISDLKRSSAYSSKNIHNIIFEGNYAYLSCDFGILVLDLDRKEIYNTYAYIGEGGTQVKVNAIAFNDTSIYAATANKIYYADKNDPLLMVYEHWNYVDDALFDNVSNVMDVCVFNNKLVVAIEKDTDTAFYYYQDTWTKFADIKSNFIKTQIVGNNLCTFERDEVNVYNKEFVKTDSVATISSIPCHFEIRDGEIAEDNSLWISQSWDYLSYINDYRKGNPCWQSITAPTSPASVHAYRMAYTDGRMLLVPGGLTFGLVPRYLSPAVFTFESNRWKELDKGIGLDGIADFVDIAVDPKDKNHYYVASAGAGIVEIKDNKPVMLYDDTNTNDALLRYVQGDYGVIRAVAVEFDSEGNLWVLNSLQDRALVVRYADGTWTNFYTASVVTNNEMKDLLVSNYTNLKWFIGKGNRIFVHDGENKFGYIDPNNGNDLKSSSINCLAEDKNGIIWIGTDKGIKTVYNTWDVFSGATLPGQLNVSCGVIHAKNELHDETRYLLETTPVTAIAIDGANRKWVGTQNAGVFLFSENMDEQLLSFTAENSILFSNNILDIEINQSTGEVFFVTDNGVVSYMGEATQGDIEYTDVYVYPNPIRPDYDGPIAIKGLVENSLIHITDVAGNVVYTTQSLGGQAIWNGRNLSGKRVATGVYLVFVADKEGEKRVVTKLLFIK